MGLVPGLLKTEDRPVSGATTDHAQDRRKEYMEEK